MYKYILEKQSYSTCTYLLRGGRLSNPLCGHLFPFPSPKVVKSFTEELQFLALIAFQILFIITASNFWPRRRKSSYFLTIGPWSIISWTLSLNNSTSMPCALSSLVRLFTYKYIYEMTENCFDKPEMDWPVCPKVCPSWDPSRDQLPVNLWEISSWSNKLWQIMQNQIREKPKRKQVCQNSPTPSAPAAIAVHSPVPLIQASNSDNCIFFF